MSTANQTTRVRFAPSPTGFLHVGGARTALFNWLFARATGGKFLLRIEDTDRERSEDRFTADILEAHKWLGMEPDEEPIYQSHRFDRYQSLVNDLISKGIAYRCDCTPAQLDAVRAQCEKEKRPFRYPGTCRKKTQVNTPSVVRVKTPDDGETGFEDMIRGRISVQNKDIDDWVVMRGDGSPTYNFSVVVDDHDQGITHILRGDDHINNTPKQILLYRDLGFEVPRFAHLPMILGSDKTKLSKRHGAASTLEYRKMGYLPLALINFLVRLGWSYGDQEIFTMEELKKYFSVDRIGKAPAVFNPDKLVWLSGNIMKDYPADQMWAYLEKYFTEETKFMADAPQKLAGIDVVKGKVKNVLELIEQLHILFDKDDPSYNEEAVTKLRKLNSDAFSALAKKLESAEFQRAPLETLIKGEAATMNLKIGDVAQALRAAVTGGKISPGLYEMLELQGKDTVNRRLKNALKAAHG